MNPADREKFSTAIGAMAEGFGRDVTAGMLQHYWAALRDLDLTDVQRAILACGRECRFLPTAAEIRQRCGAGADAIAEKAWETVVKAIQEYGYTYSVRFQDPVVTRCLERLGGWETVTGQESAELHKWTHKAFLEAYVDLFGCDLEVRTLKGATHTALVGIEAPYLADSAGRIEA